MATESPQDPHPHDHDDDAEVKLLRALRMAHDIAIAADQDCEYFNAYLHHLAEILATSNQDGQDAVLASVAEEANRMRRNRLEVAFLLKVPTAGSAH